MLNLKYLPEHWLENEQIVEAFEVNLVKTTKFGIYEDVSRFLRDNYKAMYDQNNMFKGMGPLFFNLLYTRPSSFEKEITRSWFNMRDNDFQIMV